MKHYVDLAFLKQWVLSSILILTVSICVSAQDIAVGTWRTHFSYNDAKLLAVTPDKVFCASSNGFFSREIAGGSTRKLSKIDGLSDVGVSALAYNPIENVLVIGYRSGFVDLVFDNRIETISDIATSNLDVEKTINDIAFESSRTFLATDLGIVVLNTSNAEIAENYVQIGAGGNEVEVFEIIEREGVLFVRTNEGIQSGNTGSNLLDFSNWSMYPATSDFSELTLVGDELFALSGSDLMRLNENEWEDTNADLPNTSSKLFEVDGNLITIDTEFIYTFNGIEFLSEVAFAGTLANDVAKVEGSYLIADSTLGLINESGSRLSPDGPVSDSFSNFRVISNQLYGFHAPSPFSFDGSEQQEEFSLFTNGSWQIESIAGFTNVSDVASYNGSLFYSSIGDGLYDELNQTAITNIPGSSSETDTVITGLASGVKLWASSFRNSNPILTMDSDQNWTSYNDVFLGNNEYLTIDLSESGIGWLGSAAGTITVLDSEENLVDLISTSDGLPASFLDIDISIEDNAWVGTSRGPALFPFASFIFSDSQGIQPSFENRTLFEDEEIRAVMTDGGNRIWFGTNKGLWVYDENTSEQIAIFNEANSPLPSDQIIQLAYNGENGEVFILTDNGMVSFRSSSSTGGRKHSNVKIFPNPVRPQYQGLVGLSGLARNVNIKVTDINGNLVKEIDANGGSASWDLRNVQGSLVGTGIYLFFSSTFDGEETFVGKIAVIR